MNKLTLSLLLFAASLLCAEPSAAKVASTSQNKDTGFVQFEFDGEPSIRVAPAGDDIAGFSCHANEEGAIRYNKKIKTVEFCDKFNWVSIKGGTSCPAGQVSTTKADGSSICFDPTCPKGQMLTKDASGNYVCASIYANMDCQVEYKKFTGEAATYTCSDGRFAVSGTCWRWKNFERAENWMNGLFIGDSLNENKTTYKCRIENGGGTEAGIHVWVNCCK